MYEIKQDSALYVRYSAKNKKWRVERRTFFGVEVSWSIIDRISPEEAYFFVTSDMLSFWDSGQAMAEFEKLSSDIEKRKLSADNIPTTQYGGELYVRTYPELDPYAPKWWLIEHLPEEKRVHPWEHWVRLRANLNKQDVADWVLFGFVDLWALDSYTFEKFLEVLKNQYRKQKEDGINVH